MSKNRTKPFLKWVGGKTQLLDVILPLIPEKYENYIEPFLGGGAVFLELEPKNAIVNDVNDNVVTSFKVIKNKKLELIRLLRKHVENYSEEYYYQLRDEWIEDTATDVEKAARFIYLNKTGYNGLYRVNSKGKINVPFGKKEKISNSTVFEKASLDRLSTYLRVNEVEILNKDYKDLEELIKPGDFVFVDPPYDSDDDKSFDSYTKKSFGKEGQKELAAFLKRLSEKKVKWMLTNHDTVLIKELYKEYRKFSVPVNRFINSDATNRVNATSETIIINYDVSEHQIREFQKQLFYKELKSSSYVLKNYVSWDMIMERLDQYEIEMNDLNLLFSKNHKEFYVNFERAYENRRDSFKLLPLLLAKRLKQKEKFMYLIKGGEVSTFNYNDKDTVISFIEESGLLEHLFCSSSPSMSIKTYLMGLEVGLTSNDKKNKSGNYMVEQISSILEKKEINFRKEVSYNEVLNQELDDDKRFDFVFEYEGKKYCLECNFFNSSGSKINSEAKRFIALNEGFKKYKNIKFIWVTDGEGLKKNRSMVDQVIDEVKDLYNLKRFEDFINRL